MDQDIKQIKDQERDVELEKEAEEVKAGKLEVDGTAVIKAAPVLDDVKALNNFFKSDKPDSRRHGGDHRGGRGDGRKRGGQRGRGEEDNEFEQKIVDLARVTRVMAGGKRMRFRACVAIGDRKGRVGVGLAKGQDVTMAIAKAVTQAKKDLITVPIVKETIPIEVREKFKAAKVLFRPAKKGKGIIAGGAVRIILELAGIPNIVAKIMGSNNHVTNVKVTMKALKRIAAYWATQKGGKKVVAEETKEVKKEEKR